MKLELANYVHLFSSSITQSAEPRTTSAKGSVCPCGIHMVIHLRMPCTVRLVFSTAARRRAGVPLDLQVKKHSNLSRQRTIRADSHIHNYFDIGSLYPCNNGEDAQAEANSAFPLKILYFTFLF